MLKTERKYTFLLNQYQTIRYYRVNKVLYHDIVLTLRTKVPNLIARQ